MTISNPKVDLKIRPAIIPETIEERKLLYIGQKTALGTATSGQLYENLETGIEYETLFGKNSMLAAMIRAAQQEISISKIKPKIDAIPFDDDGGAVAASGAVNFGGAATEDKTITVSIGSKNYELTITDTQTANQIGIALQDAVNNDDIASVTASNAGGAVTLTAVNKGTVANKIGIRVDSLVAGVSIGITAMSGGTTDPDISSVETTIENLRYSISMPAQYDVASIITFLENRFNITDPIIKDGELIIADTDTFANFIASIVGQNKKTLVFFPNKKIDDVLYKGSLHFQLDYEIAARILALRALRLTTGAEISDIVDASLESRDNFGGIGIATLPYHNTPLHNIPLGDRKLSWTNDELTELIDKGFAIFGNNEANLTTILGTVVTKYKTNDEGQPDLSFKYLNYVDQAVVVREYFTNQLKQRFRQARLTTGDLIPRINMANKGVIIGECLRIYGDLAVFGLMVAGEQARKVFLDNLTVEIDEALGKATVTMINPAVTQLREVEGIIQTTFSII